MGDDPYRGDAPRTDRGVDRPAGNGGLIFALVAIALILAIGFFYLTNERREDRRADAVTHAADSVDNAARIVGDAAKNAADDLRNNN
ncbi:hypothetical protein PMI04_007395 [Sphingobium sp. AP49]|uniref:hypothetical protein n=1 Tax=Sphingobium sp. AP49 TaxID=1144307 RepID=UPI00026EE2EA|nr:hypothetical protein [Sphingobium sp. AP49]WHO40409.1 hypothetical protein PMI04_007395 [Sphingobium sp. AP49]